MAGPAQDGASIATKAWREPCFEPAPVSFAGATQSRFNEVRGAFIVTVGALIWMALLSPQPKTEFEISRDFLSARDCLELGRCTLIGPPSSTLNFHQGAGWIEFLTAVRFAVGAGAMATLNLVTLTVALGIGTLYLVTRRWIGPPLALPAAILALGLQGFIRDAGEFVNPCVMFLPAVLSAAGLLIFALTGRLSYLLWSAAFVAITSATHTGGLSLIPAVLAFAAAAGALAFTAASAVLVGVGWFISSEAITRTLHDMTVSPLLALPGILVTVVLARLLRSRFLKLNALGRSAVVAVCLCGPFAVFMMYRELPGVTKGGHAWLYWPPVLAPVVIVLAYGLVRLQERLGHPRLARLISGVPWAALALSVLLGPMVRNAIFWTYESTWTVHQRLAAEGWSLSRMHRGLQMNGPHDVMLGLIPYAKRESAADAPFRPRRQYRVLLRQNNELDALPARSEILPLSLSRDVVVLSPIDSWLDPWNASVCRTLLSIGGAQTKCARVSEPTDLTLTPFSFTNRLETRDAAPSFPGEPACRIAYALPFSATGGGPHTFSAPPGWVIARVEGGEIDRTLPAPRVRVNAREDQPARLTLEQEGPGPCEGDVEFPGLVEATRDDPEWMWR